MAAGASAQQPAMPVVGLVSTTSPDDFGGGANCVVNDEIAGFISPRLGKPSTLRPYLIGRTMPQEHVSHCRRRPSVGPWSGPETVLIEARVRAAARARSWEFLSLPNRAVEVLVHARRHCLLMLISNVCAYHLRVREAVTANAAMPLVAGKDVGTPLGAFWIVFGIAHFNRS